MSPSAVAILKTLIFFDVQDLPLTLLEIQNYLLAAPGVTTPMPAAALAQTIATELLDRVALRDGWYFLAGRERLVALRRARYRISLQRLFKARRYLWGLRYVPYLRTVGISGSLAFLNSKPSSDLDLFVIAKKNRIWLTRLLVALYFQILGQRRHGQLVSNRFCLNHFVTEGLTVQKDRDLFTAASYASILPVCGAAALAEFWDNNPWIREYFPAAVLERHHSFFPFVPSRWQKVWEILLEGSGLAAALNWLAGIYQKHRIRRQEDIVVREDELSFHFSARSQSVLQRFEDECRALPKS